MSGKEIQGSGVNRRGLITVLGTGVITIASIAYAALSRSADKEQADRNPDPIETEPEKPSSDLEMSNIENIEDFGATPGMDTEAVARENTEAIRGAAREAGENGTVYIPEGEYFFGMADEEFAFRFGHDEPKGISLVGAGPRESRLIFTSTVNPSRGYRAFRYESKDRNGKEIDHGKVTAKDICFDGNYEELDMDAGTTIWGYYAYGDGHFTLDNVWIRGWWANASKFEVTSTTIRRSTFEENAIGVTQAADSTVAGHHIVATPEAGNTVLIEDCEFLRCSGSVVNRQQGSGDVILRRTWVRAAGHSCFKLSRTNGTTRVENTYFQAQTDWLVQNLPEAYGDVGRWFLYRTSGDEYTPVVVLDNVVAREISHNAILCYQETGIVLNGTGIAIHDAAMDETQWTRGAIRADSEIEFNINSMSVHGTGGNVFDAKNASGSINILYRGSNSGLGYIGNLSLDDKPQSVPLQPDVVSRDQVGIESESDVS